MESRQCNYAKNPLNTVTNDNLKNEEWCSVVEVEDRKG